MLRWIYNATKKNKNLYFKKMKNLYYNICMFFLILKNGKFRFGYWHKTHLSLGFKMCLWGHYEIIYFNFLFFTIECFTPFREDI